MLTEMLNCKTIQYSIRHDWIDINLPLDTRSLYLGSIFAIWIQISRVDKQRCLTASFFESAYLISKFAEIYALSCWQKCMYYNEHQSLWSKSCSNNAYLLG